MSFVLALDQGTTSSRAIVFDHAGTVRAVAQREFRQIFPQPGWVEHDADGDLGDAVGRHARGARQGGHRRRATSPPIGITNQRETTVLWDRATGRPSPTPSSGRTGARRRCATRCAPRATPPMIARKTGLVLDAYFSGTKLKWLLDNVPGARARAAQGELAFGTIDAWLVWNLTRGAVARDRSVEREPHAALRHPRQATGTTSCSRSSTCRARCCRASCRRRAICAPRD